QLLEGELDAASIHRAILFGPRSGGAERHAVSAGGATGENQGRDRAGDEQSLRHRLTEAEDAGSIAAGPRKTMSSVATQRRCCSIALAAAYANFFPPGRSLSKPRLRLRKSMVRFQASCASARLYTSGRVSLKKACAAL